MPDLIENLIGRYITAAVAHGEASENANSRLANRSYHKKIKALHALDRASPEGRKVLRRLYSHPDAAVRSSAAAHLLHEDGEIAVTVLEEVSKGPGVVAFDAEMVLREWRAGRLKIP